MVSQVLSHYAAWTAARAKADDFGNDHSFSCVLSFAALGLLVTVIALGLNIEVASF